MKKIDNKIVKIMKIGISFSFAFCIIAAIILLIYNISSNPNTFYIGMSLIKSSLFFIVGFVICGFIFDKIINEI